MWPEIEDYLTVKHLMSKVKDKINSKEYVNYLTELLSLKTCYGSRWLEIGVLFYFLKDKKHSEVLPEEENYIVTCIEKGGLDMQEEAIGVIDLWDGLSKAGIARLKEVYIGCEYVQEYLNEVLERVEKMD